MPAFPKVTPVEVAVGVAKATAPGPLTVVQAAATGAATGRPSSVTEPVRVAPAGRVSARSGPASATGAAFTGSVPGAGPYSTCRTGALATPRS